MGEIIKKIDLAGVGCPMNFVKMKIALDEVGAGELVEAILDEGDAMLNVPRSLKDEGHKILKVEKNDNDTFTILVQRG